MRPAVTIAALGFVVALARDACHRAAWLPCPYFGAGAVASGLWAALDA